MVLTRKRTCLVALCLAGSVLSGCGRWTPYWKQDPDYTPENVGGRELVMFPVHGLSMENAPAFRAAWRDSLGNAVDESAEKRLFDRILFDRVRYFFEPVTMIHADSLRLSDADVVSFSARFDVEICWDEHIHDSVAEEACRATADSNAQVERVFHRPSRRYLEQHGIRPDLVLVVSDVVTYTKPGKKADVASTESYPPSLMIRGLFLVWDYERDQPVTYGGIETFRNKKPRHPRTWYLLLEKSAFQIADKSPFQGERVSDYLTPFIGRFDRAGMFPWFFNP